MEAYTDFASVYDRFMDNTPYEKWCGNIVSKLGEYGIRARLWDRQYDGASSL